MNYNYVFLGLVHITTEQQAQNKKKNSVKLIEFPDDAVNQYLEQPGLYNERRQQANHKDWPFITKFAKKPEYLIVLRKDANQDFLKQIRLEEFIIQNLPSDYQEQEWKNKATSILLTWNLAELNQRISDQRDQTSPYYANRALYYLILAVISFIGANILKHFFMK